MRKLLSVVLSLVLVLSLCASLAYAEEVTIAPGSLTDLLVEDSAGLVDFKFDANTAQYNFTVFEDVYGILFTPVITGGTDASIKVTMSGSGIEKQELSVLKNGTFELHLDENRECAAMATRGMEDDCDYTVVVEAANGSYTINVHRPGTDALVEKFQRLTWPVPDDSGKEMNYWLYVPEDYDESKAYPVVLAPHGGGQRSVDAEDILVRTAQATTFAKYGKECIIIAPHSNYTDLSCTDGTGWRLSTSDDIYVPSQFTLGAMEILNNVIENYNVDENRIYACGASMGGHGAQTFIANYPDVFAAAIIMATSATEKQAELLAKTVKEHGISVWFVHHQEDPLGTDAGMTALAAAFDAAEADYHQTIYTESTYLWPTCHFSWVPFMADEEHLDWLLAQTKMSDEGGELKHLMVEDGSNLVDFDFDKFELVDGKYVYNETLTVFSDVYGIRFTPTISGNDATTIHVEVATENNGLLKKDLAYTYDDNIWNDTTDGEQAIDVARNEKFVLHLSEKRLCSAYAETMQENDCNYTVTITDSKNQYVINVLRPGTDKISGAGEAELDGLFKLNTWSVPDESGKEMYYYLYIPADYDATKSYPVLVVPHGGGQFRNPVKDLLVRTLQAGGMAYYEKDCIILVPQGNYTDLSAESLGWCDSQLKLSAFGEGTMEILADVESKYNVDKNRIYVGGGSMGGVGTCGFLATYPEVFAAGAITCPAGGQAGYMQLARSMKENGTALYLIHSQADATVGFDSSALLQAAFDSVGVSYKTMFLSKTDFLYPTNHFSWQWFFNNEDCIDWLLAQSK